jgi:hypothetical protein
MGYETTIYIGQPGRDGFDYNTHWFHVFGHIDCSKIGSLITVEARKSGIPCYIFGDDGDTKITEDKYGQVLVAVPIKKVIEGLKEHLKGNKYSRAQWAYDALRSMKKKRKGYHGMVATHCILFGH